jgi:prepilin-type N-terminal cleavage/methylation domain-containing protein
MTATSQKAFTLIELTMVIVVIGILAAIALPRFTTTAQEAYLAKAQSTLAAVQTSLNTERQRRILQGNTRNITDLGTNANAFDNFVPNRQDRTVVPVLRSPEPNCAAGQTACWSRQSSEVYNYVVPPGITATDGSAVSGGSIQFRLLNNRFFCNEGAAECDLLE